MVACTRLAGSGGWPPRRCPLCRGNTSLCFVVVQSNFLHARSGCRILDDVGGAFGMGVVGGGLWHLLKGMKNSPSGHRFVGGIDVRAQNRPLGSLVVVCPDCFGSWLLLLLPCACQPRLPAPTLT